MPKTKEGKSSKNHLMNIYNAQEQIRALKSQHRKALRKQLVGVYENALILTDEEIEELYNHPFWNDREGRKPMLEDGEIVRTSTIFAHDARTEEENKPAMEQANAFQFLANQGVDPANVEKFLKGKSYRELSKAYVESKRGTCTSNRNGSTKSSNKGNTHATQTEDDWWNDDDADDQHGGDGPKGVKGKQAPAAAWAAPKITGLEKIELNGEPELVEETDAFEEDDLVDLRVRIRKTTQSGTRFLRLVAVRPVLSKAPKQSERRKIDPRKSKAASQRPSHSSGKPRHSA